MLDDPEFSDLLRRGMVARIATVSRNGRPNVNPLYFVVENGLIQLGTSDRTLAVFNAEADPRVLVLLENERDRADRRLLRVRGTAEVRRDPEASRRYRRQVTRKYMATPAGLRNLAAHWRKLLVLRSYVRSRWAGDPCVIEVTPESVDLAETMRT